MSASSPTVGEVGDEPDALVPIADGAAWSAIASLARSVDRQLEQVRSVLECEGAGGHEDPRMTEIHRAGAAIASASGAIVNDPANAAAPGVAETARCLATIGALTRLVLDAARPAHPGGPGAPEPLPPGARDIVLVLGDVVTEQFRALTGSYGSDAGPARLAPSGLPVEIFLRQLDEHESTSAWQMGALWVAIALKVTEAARWCPAAPPGWAGSDPRPDPLNPEPEDTPS